MFSDITSISSILTILVLAILIGLILYKFIKVKILKKTENTSLDMLIEKLQTNVIAAVATNDTLKKLENEKGREAVIKYILDQLKLIIDKANFLGATEKILLKAVDLTVVANLIVTQLISLGVLTKTNDVYTKADSNINSTLESTTKIASGGKDAGEIVSSLIGTALENVGVPSNIVDGIIEPIVEEVVETVIPKPIIAESYVTPQESIDEVVANVKSETSVEKSEEVVSTSQETSSCE